MKKYIFPILVLLAYIITALLDYELAKNSFIYFLEIFSKIIWIFGIIFVLMVLINLFWNPSVTKKYLWKSSWIKSCFFAIIAWILVWWPPYVLYPMLWKLKKQWMSNSLLAVFLYNRNVKIQFLPLSIVYFWLPFTIVLSLYVMIFSVISWIIMGRFKTIK